MPGPLFFRPPLKREPVMLGRGYVFDETRKPGPMAPPGHPYPDVWAKKRKR